MSKHASAAFLRNSAEEIPVAGVEPATEGISKSQTISQHTLALQLTEVDASTDAELNGPARVEAPTTSPAHDASSKLLFDFTGSSESWNKFLVTQTGKLGTAVDAKKVPVDLQNLIEQTVQVALKEVKDACMFEAPTGSSTIVESGTPLFRNLEGHPNPFPEYISLQPPEDLGDQPKTVMQRKIAKVKGRLRLVMPGGGQKKAAALDIAIAPKLKQASVVSLNSSQVTMPLTTTGTAALKTIPGSEASDTQKLESPIATAKQPQLIIDASQPTIPESVTPKMPFDGSTKSYNRHKTPLSAPQFELSQKASAGLSSSDLDVINVQIHRDGTISGNSGSKLKIARDMLLGLCVSVDANGIISGKTLENPHNTIFGGLGISGNGTTKKAPSHLAETVLGDGHFTMIQRTGIVKPNRTISTSFGGYAPGLFHRNAGQKLGRPLVSSKKLFVPKAKAKAKVEELPGSLLVDKLPTELHLCILDYLDPVSSTCLGVTCKKFYGIHRERYGTVSLFKENLRGKPLFLLLYRWILSGSTFSGLSRFSTRNNKFVSASSYYELELDGLEKELLKKKSAVAYDPLLVENLRLEDRIEETRAELDKAKRADEIEKVTKLQSQQRRLRS